jgi:hypothetical protein
MSFFRSNEGLCHRIGDPGHGFFLPLQSAWTRTTRDSLFATALSSCRRLTEYIVSQNNTESLVQIRFRLSIQLVVVRLRFLLAELVEVRLMFFGLGEPSQCKFVVANDCLEPGGCFHPVKFNVRGNIQLLRELTNLFILHESKDSVKTSSFSESLYSSEMLLQRR